MEKQENNKLGLLMLVLLGIGSMIGGGIFNSPTDLIKQGNPQAVLIGWIVGGIGVISLALVFNLLANKKSELTGGIYAYAKEGFGNFAGFNSAWGYWLSAWLGNVAFVILLFKTLSDFTGGMNPFITFILASIFLWSVFLLQIKGVKNAGIINAVATVAKLVPIVLAIILGVLVFKKDIFVVQNWKNTLAATGEATSLLKQVNGSMGAILWCFVGIEAAVVLSERAKSQKIVGKAIIISLLSTLAIYMLVSIIAMGVIPAKELGNSITPFSDLLGKTAIGQAGALVARLGLIISLFGAFISWVMLAAETPYILAKDGAMPKYFSKTNKNDCPVNSLFITTVCTQLFLLSLLSSSFQKAYSMVFNIATTAILIPYLLSAFYGLKVSIKENFTFKDKIISAIASLYTAYVVYSVGLTYIGLTVILYAFGILVYLKAKKEHGKSIDKKEKVAMAIIVLIALLVIALIATGKITV
ncbi:basic amino acid/polyamine antiporter [Hathewaya histolytica]|uniref:Arginine/ornithine antiporter n=1 Tax=Hathewaya histolytica TaxID=1498 RepID=A0A4U9RQW6_HATHI|nr:basic amino acid/polyamine antiporter [Hathewaya histolytica]VTQ94645.1 arginine/ornithine antiporter [Hathewaya histolytica]